MNIFRRLKNLWRISEWVETSYKDGKPHLDILKPTELDKPHLAQVIKRTTPVQDFMEKTKENV